MHSSTFKDQNYCAVAQFMWPNQSKVKLAYYVQESEENGMPESEKNCGC